MNSWSFFYFPTVGKIIGVSRHTQFPFKVLFVSFFSFLKKVICRSKISPTEKKWILKAFQAPKTRGASSSPSSPQYLLFLGGVRKEKGRVQGTWGLKSSSGS